MNVLIAGASSETQYVAGVNAYYDLQRRPGDKNSLQHTSIGYVSREEFVDKLLAAPDLDALLLLDVDQRHPADLLERLRDAMEAGDLDMVCAHYYRRGTSNVQSLCYPIGDGTYPQLPYLDPPTTGLHELLTTGFGCVLIHKRVVAAVQASLPAGENAVAIGPLPETTGNWDVVGQDFRFFLRARALGYRLWLLADVESLHGSTIWLGHKSARKLANYEKWADASYDLFEERLRLHGMNPQAYKQRLTILEARKRGLEQKFNDAVAAPAPDLALLQEVTVALHRMDGHLDECRAWLEWAEKYPPIEYPEQLPTRDNTADHPTFEDAADVRQQVHTERSMELIAQLPDVGAAGRNGAGRAD